MGKTWSGLKLALVGCDGRLSGRGSPTWSRIGKVWADHGIKSEANVKWGAAPQAKTGDMVGKDN